ncbi:hypothetical protein SARC_03944 [Sphaeroforma arctica JP610]|uniref:Uncharacterized protein n=1 Tax=Sphaeroforma arctica JP610 TaxID=667725 RepID=A0A0L0G434_9EUKA|nr:hypothetical protein SARC_03944 [Sphaeroforma arctica JP610]KNC83815.1 hypothetical protein SARC_03944 [Sphaeroforma arctica JP610]|eukprot:XP_014157717.1 hypothetical protein SARC_03944 [Sphaeroforma arctica JP610]
MYCDRNMHAFCGVHPGEGFGTNSISYCLSTDNCKPPNVSTAIQSDELTPPASAASLLDQTTTDSDAMQEVDTTQSRSKQGASSGVNEASDTIVKRLSYSIKKNVYKQTVLSKVCAVPAKRVNLTNNEKGVVVRTIKKSEYDLSKPWRDNYKSDLVKEAVQAARTTYGISIKTIQRFMIAGEKIISLSTEMHAKRKYRERKGTISSISVLCTSQVVPDPDMSTSIYVQFLALGGTWTYIEV